MRPLAALCVLTLAGCAGLTIPVVTSPAQRAGTGTLRAGASVVDVTPPAGLGTFGHGPEARAARGHRGRLRCRVIYIEDARGENVALVPCDFAAVDLLLVRTIAQRVAPRVRLGAERIVMSATHTHGGPAHYFVARNYNGLFSGRVRGYDRAFVAWLASRIARAIDHAYDSAEPARIGFVSVYANTDEGNIALAENRSLAAHCANVDPMQGGTTTCGTASPDPVAEVYGKLDLLRIDVVRDGTPHPLALYATFPVHGTAVANTNAFFEADLWGFAARSVEARLRSSGSPFVAALTIGAAGDVRPRYAAQGWSEAKRLGRLLGARIVVAHARVTELDAALDVRLAYRDLDMRAVAAPNGTDRTCAGAQLGRSAPGGSEEGRTGLYGSRWHEGMTDPRRSDCFAPAAGFPLSRIASHGFPFIAPLQIVRIGPHTIVAHPWELTTTAAMRMRASAGGRLNDPSVMLVGLANEYMQYLTTPEEFDAQAYEGASTLYGRASLPVVIAALDDLATRLGEGGDRTPYVDMRAFETESPPHVRDRFRAPADAAAPVLRASGSGPILFERQGAFAVTFFAGPPHSFGADVVVRVERRSATGTFTQAFDAFGDPLDDTHEDVLFEHVEHGRHLWREALATDPTASARTHRDAYRAVWSPDPTTPPGEYRFVVTSAGRSLGTAPFVLAPVVLAARGGADTTAR